MKKSFALLSIVVDTVIIFFAVVLARRLYLSYELNVIQLALAAVIFSIIAVVGYLVVAGKKH